MLKINDKADDMNTYETHTAYSARAARQEFPHIDIRFEVGDTIRAHDFEPMPGSADMFIEGDIVNIVYTRGALFYVVKCLHDSMYTGKNNRVGQEVYVPVEMWREYHDRIKFIWNREEDTLCEEYAAWSQSIDDQLDQDLGDRF